MPDQGSDRPSDEQATTESRQAFAGHAERIGPYRILQRIGRGGMGEVHEAEQDQPVRRRVALKVIKAGLDSEQVLARFEAERQALAMMDHPNVARVYDAGTTPDGRPYFAMEYVRGVPITEHCDRQRLSTRERLQLFMQVCEGVQHAHQNAIIHRDIKPSNVLVTIRDGHAIPKIIDFGLAKATAQRLTERTLFTELGQIIGTPEYMSPEQAEMTGQNVDTRTDVYSLGVLLYEMLVGALPFDARELRRAGFDEMRRKIREEEPSRPSTRLSSLGDASTESARRRRSDPATLARQLRGDLDWITMKALEKDRTRRYGSPSELAGDIRRHLGDQPVVAGPPSTAYRARKFIRRHRIGVSFAATLTLLLIGFGIGMSVLYARAVEAEATTAKEAETARQALEFMTEMFEVSDPSESRGDTITAREILDKAATRIDESLAGQPEVQSRLMNTIGKVYLNLGLYDPAELLFERVVDTRKRVLGDDHPSTLGSMNNLAALYWRQGRYDEAEPLYRETLATRKRVLGDDHPRTLGSMNNLALLYESLGRHDEAEPLYVETLETQKRVLGDDHPNTLSSMNNLALVYRDQGRYDEAERLHDEALATRKRVLGDDHPDTLSSMNNLAILYLDRGRYDEAERLYGKALETRKRVLGDDHPDTLVSMNNLANLYANQGRHDESERLYGETIESRKRVLGDDHPATLGSMLGLASVYTSRGRYDEAERLYGKALESRKRVLGDDHPDTLVSMNNLANLYRRQGRYEEAEPLYRETLEAQERVLGGDHPETLRSVSSLAILYASQGRFVAAGPLFERALETRRRVLGDDHPSTLSSMNSLAESYRMQGRYGDAEPLYRQTLETQERMLGEDHVHTAVTVHNLACLARDTGRYDEARRKFERAQRIWEAKLGTQHPYVAENLTQWAALLRKAGDDAGADRLDARVRAIRTK